MKKRIILTTLCVVVLAVFGSKVWAQSQTDAPTLTIDKEATTFDFGTIQEEGGPVTHEFTVTNTGSSPLVINSVRASCGCTTPSWTKEAIIPGKDGKITATYNPNGRPGAFNKSITISTNADPASYVFHIKGVVENSATKNTK